MNETNAELEEMDTVEARDEAYERTRETVLIDEYVDYDYETSMSWDFWWDLA